MTGEHEQATTAELDELRALTREVLGGHSGAETSGTEAWSRLESSDLVGVSLPEQLGGSGGGLAEAAAVLSAVAAAGLELPLVETTWLAGWLAARGGHEVPSGPTLFVTAPDVTARRNGDGWVLQGAVEVSGASADEVHLLLPDAAAVAVLPGPPGPVSRLRVDTRVDGSTRSWRPLPAPLADVQRELHLRAALGRAVEISGALSSALDLAVEYAGQRVQFGRSLSRNQVIQHYLARVATLVHGVRVATDAGVAAMSAGATEESGTEVAVHAAKAVASQAVDEATELVHQVFGAIGTTEEHPLHRRTLSLWSWRDAAGSEVVHASALADLLLGDGDDAWSTLVPVTA